MSPRSLLCGLLALAFLASAPSLASAQDKGKKYALLVGVRTYDRMTDLQYTENDVEELGQILSARSAGFEVTFLTNARGGKDDRAKPTTANIRKSLKQLLDKVTKHDLVVLGFAGHGLTLTFDDPQTKREREESFFCPTDARPMKSRDLKDLESTMIPLFEVFNQLKESGAGVKLMFIDACRNELTGEQARNMDVERVPRPPKGTAVLFSCKSGERAWESPKLGKAGHGVFFHHVLEGLRGKAKNTRGQVTWDLLAAYVKEQVVDVVPVIVGGGANQTPHEVKDIIGQPPVLLGAAAPSAAGADVAKWYREGMELHTGLKGKGDDAAAAKRFAQAADQGHAAAGLALAYLTQFGMGVPLSRDRAERLANANLTAARDAADRGDADASQWLGSLYLVGIGVRRDLDLAGKWLEAPAKSGEPYPIAVLAYLLSLKGEYKESQRLFEQAADKGLPWAMRFLGERQLDGSAGTPVNVESAVRLFKRAAERNDKRSMLLLGNCAYGGRGLLRDLKEAFAWYRRSAEAGDDNGMINVGWMLLKAEGTDRDDKEAVEWFRKAAALRSMGGQYALGRVYLEGRGVDRDPREAARYFRQSADQGWSLGMYDLGELFRTGNGVERNEQLADQWLRKAAEHGHAVAAFRLGEQLEAGRGVRRDMGQALGWYRKSAANGNAAAMRQVGAFYQTGLGGVERDLEEALKWYRHAAGHGDADAMSRIGLFHSMGWAVQKNQAEAMAWYRKAADRGLAAAMFNLAVNYESGALVAKDAGEAKRWFGKIIESGDTTVMHTLGDYYRRGEIVRQDHKEARAWFLRAAEKGNQFSMYEMAQVYEHGRGVEKDHAEALKWLKKAAEAGHAAAMNGVGYYYRYGLGTEKDLKEAVKWHRKSADAGEMAAFYYVGLAYELGEGVEKDIKEAIRWYRKAADRGYQAGQQKLTALEGKGG